MALLAFTLRANPLSWRVAYVCRWIALSAHFPTEEIWKSDSLLFFVLLLLRSKLTVFRCYNILEHCVNLQFLSWGSTALDKVLRSYFLDNSTYLLLDPAEMLGGSMYQMSDLFSKVCPVIPLNFFPGHTFSNMNYEILASPAIWIDQEPPKSSSSGFHFA